MQFDITKPQIPRSYWGQPGEKKIIAYTEIVIYILQTCNTSGLS